MQNGIIPVAAVICAGMIDRTKHYSFYVFICCIASGSAIGTHPTGCCEGRRNAKNAAACPTYCLNLELVRSAGSEPRKVIGMTCETGHRCPRCSRTSLPLQMITGGSSYRSPAHCRCGISDGRCGQPSRHRASSRGSESGGGRERRAGCG